MAMALFMAFYAYLSMRRKIYSKQIGIASLFPIFSICFVVLTKKKPCLYVKQRFLVSSDSETYSSIADAVSA